MHETTPAASPEAGDGRQLDLAAGLARITERIGTACADAGRSPAEITLVVVTKTFPAADVRALGRLGVGDVGENKVQEAAAKVEDGALAGIRLHLIGRLQSNKAVLAGSIGDVIHCVDRERLLAPLARGRESRGVDEPLPVLIQVSLDDDPQRGGIPADGVEKLAEAVLASPLRLAGVMAVPPLGADPDECFARLAEISERLRRSAPSASWISAGMSADLEAAVANGATHLRVGSAILGSRGGLR